MLPIGDPERRLALHIARASLAEFLTHRKTSEHQVVSPCLQQLRATFVTLRLRGSGELRGCRGECRASRPLLASVIRQTIASATDDVRFRSVTTREISRLTIRISALTPLVRIEPEHVIVGRHGLLIVQGRQSGLLLPEVPMHHGMTTPGQFLEALCRKAGLPTDSLNGTDAQLYAFETESWSDEDPDLFMIE
jgi:AmmeMemoRadiSam system protein A